MILIADEAFGWTAGLFLRNAGEGWKSSSQSSADGATSMSVRAETTDDYAIKISSIVFRFRFWFAMVVDTGRKKKEDNVLSTLTQNLCRQTIHWICLMACYSLHPANTSNAMNLCHPPSILFRNPVEVFRRRRWSRTFCLSSSADAKWT